MGRAGESMPPLGATAVTDQLRDGTAVTDLRSTFLAHLFKLEVQLFPEFIEDVSTGFEWQGVLRVPQRAAPVVATPSHSTSQVENILLQGRGTEVYSSQTHLLQGRGTEVSSSQTHVSTSGAAPDAWAKASASLASRMRPVSPRALGEGDSGTLPTIGDWVADHTNECTSY